MTNLVVQYFFVELNIAIIGINGQKSPSSIKDELKFAKDFQFRRTQTRRSPELTNLGES